MNKKEINEIKKQFTPEHCTISRICGCYVDYEKNKVLLSKDAFLSLPEEEEHKYFDIFKKVLSGTIGKNLVTIDFPTQFESKGESQDFFMRLLDSELQDDALIEELYNNIIDKYHFDENYYIILINAAYDVPGKSTDGSEMFDASDNVYRYILCAICPVTMSKAGLSYSVMDNAIKERIRDWVVQPPVSGLLFPAFEDRASDIHKILYYSKNPEIYQEDFLSDIIGEAKLLTPCEQKESFAELITQTLRQNGDFDTVKSIQENINELIEEAQESDGVFELDKVNTKRILSDSGVDDEDVELFDELYDEQIGKDAQIYLNNVADTKKFQIEMPDIIIKTDPEHAMLIETMEINGRDCIVIPADGNIEVNGISVRVRNEREI